MKCEVGFNISRLTGEVIPILHEMSEEDYKASCERMESELYNLVRDYVFDKLKEKEGLSL